MDPGAHCELCDEDVAALGKEDGGLGRDHLDFRIGLHYLLDTRERKLMDFEVVLVVFEMSDGLLPVRSEDILVLACQALVDLGSQYQIKRSKVITHICPRSCVQFGGGISLLC